MTRKILVADRDPAYAQALAQRIQKHCPACTVMTASDEASFHLHLAETAGELSLVVSAAHFPVDSLPSGVSQLILLDTRFEPQDAEQPQRPARLGPVKPILDRLDMARSRRVQLADTPAQAQPDLHSKEGHTLSGSVADPTAFIVPRSGSTPPAASIPMGSGMLPAAAAPATGSMPPAAGLPPAAGDPSTAAGLRAAGELPPDVPERPRRVVLLLTQSTHGRQSAFADQRCMELGRSGEPVCYLPLLPSVLCRQAPASGPGNSYGLTDLLLRIGCGGIAPGDLGAYMAVDSLGRMQLRPTARADDLLDCGAHELFQLVALLRERILSEARGILVIEAAGIPYRSIRAVMPLCDQVEAIMPEDAGFASQSLRREISDALAELPPAARVVQVPELRAVRHVPA